MEGIYLIEMNTKEKCEKLAKVLETVAEKLRDSEIGEKVWEQDEVLMKSLIAQVHLFLKKAIDVSEEDLPSTAKLKRKSKKSIQKDSDDDKILNHWPDILK